MACVPYVEVAVAPGGMTLQDPTGCAVVASTRTLKTNHLRAVGLQGRAFID